MTAGGVALSKSDVQTVSKVVGDDLVVVEMMVVSGGGSKIAAAEAVGGGDGVFNGKKIATSAISVQYGRKMGPGALERAF